MKINNYLNQLLPALEYFVTREWIFHRYNMTEMMTKVKMLEDNVGRQRREVRSTRHGLEEVYQELPSGNKEIHSKRKL